MWCVECWTHSGPQVLRFRWVSILFLRFYFMLIVELLNCWLKNVPFTFLAKCSYKIWLILYDHWHKVLYIHIRIFVVRPVSLHIIGQVQSSKNTIHFSETSVPPTEKKNNGSVLQAHWCSTFVLRKLIRRTNENWVWWENMEWKKCNHIATFPHFLTVVPTYNKYGTEIIWININLLWWMQLSGHKSQANALMY